MAAHKTNAPIDRRLEAFRGRNQSQPLHWEEKALLWILGFHLCFLPWALGTNRVWGQLSSVILAVAEFAVALLPRRRVSSGGEQAVRLLPWMKLKRFPIFWIGAGLLLLMAIQGLNPSWRFVQNVHYWYVVRVQNITWLPTGVEAPFGRFNVWRDFIIGAGVWLTTCAVWVGLMRRKSLRILLGVLTANGIALGLLQAYQHLTGNSYAPEFLSKLAGAPLNASFVYKNHAGAYFALVAFAAVALATWHYDRGTRQLLKSTPAGALGIAALFLGGSVLFTLSRGASIILAISLLAFAVWFLVRRKVQSVGQNTDSRITMMVVVIFALFALNILRYVDFSRVAGRFDEMATLGAKEEGIRSRVLVHKADTDMLCDQWLRGVGAGGFRYLFPQYQIKYRELRYDGNDGAELYWEHAHGDWWEVPIELGLAGDLLLLAGGGWWIWRFVSKRTAWHAFSVPLLLGCAQTVIHAMFDFPFQCPAILTTWCVLIAVAAKGLEE